MIRTSTSLEKYQKYRSGKESTPATIDSDRSTTGAADHPITSSVGKSSSTPKADLETDKTLPLSYTKETPVSTPAKATDITDLSQGIHTSQTSSAPLSGVTPVSTSQRSSPVPVGKTSGMPETTSGHTDRSGKESTPATIDSDRSTTSAADHPLTSSVRKSSSTPKADLETDKTQPSSYTKETPISTPAKATDITDSSQAIHTSPSSTAPLSGVTPVSATQRSPVPVGKTSGIPQTTSALTDRSGKESTPATIDSDRSTTGAAEHPITSSVEKFSSTPKADLETDKTLPLSYTKETPISTPAKATDITDLSQGIHTSQTSSEPLSGVTPVSTSQRSSPVPVGKTSGMPETTSDHTDRSGKESTPATIDSERSTTSAADHPLTSSVRKSSSTPKADLETDKTQPSSYTKETPISTPAKATDITDLSQAIHTSQTSTAPLSGVTPVSATQRSSPVPVGKTSGIPQTTSALTGNAYIYTRKGHRHHRFVPRIHTSQTSSEPLSGVTPVSTSQRSSPVPVGKTSGMPETTSDHTDRSGKESTPATIDSERSTTSAADHPLTSSVRKSSSTPKADLETDKTQPSSYTKETPISTPAKATDITDLSQAIHTSQTSTAPLSGVTPVSATQRSPVPVGKTSGIPQTTSALTDRSGKESTPATIDSDRSTTGAAEHPITSSVEKFSSTPKADLETDKTLPLSYTKETPISTPAKATDITDLSQAIHTSPTSTAPLSGVTPVSATQRSSPVPVGKTSGIPQTTSALTGNAYIYTAKATDITDLSQAIHTSQTSTAPLSGVTPVSATQRSPVPVGKTSGIPQTTSALTDRSGKESTPATIDSDRSTTGAAEHPITSSVEKFSSTPKADLETDKTLPLSYTKETPISTPAKATDITDLSQAIHTSPTSTAPLSGVTPVSATQRSSPVPVGKTSGIPQTTSALTDRSGKESTPATIDSDRSTTGAAEHPITSSVEKFSSTPKADLETDKTLPLSYTKETPISTPAKATDITDLSQGIHTSQTSSEPLSDRSGKESTPATIDSERSTTSAADHPLTSSVRKSSSTPKADLETDKTQPSSYTKETPISTPAKATDITDLSQAIHTSQTSTAPLSGVTPVSATQRSPVPVGKTSGIPQTTSALTGNAYIYTRKGHRHHRLVPSNSHFSDIDGTFVRCDACLCYPKIITCSVGKHPEYHKLLLLSLETPISTPAKATDITDLSQGIHTSQTSSEPLSGVTPVSTSQRSSPVPVGKTSGMPETTSDHTDRSGKGSTPATIDSDRSTTSAADHPLTSSVRKSSSTPKADLETDKTQPSSYTKETPISTPAKATDITDSSQAIYASPTSTAPLSGVTPVSATQRSPVPVGKTSGIPQTTSALTDRSGKESTPATIDSDRSTTGAAEHPITSSVEKFSSTPKADLETDKTLPLSYTKETPISTPAKATDITDLSQAIHTSPTSTAPLSGVTPVSATQRSSPVPVGKTSGIPQTTSALTDRSGKESTPATIDSDRSTTGAAEHPITSSVEKFSSTPKADLETDKTLPLSYTKETPISTPAKATDITDLSQGIHTSQTSSEPLSGVTPVSTSQRSSPVPVGKTSGMPETTSDHTDRSGKGSTPATIDSERSTTSAADHPLTSSVRKSSSTPKADLETDKTQPSSYTKETPISTPAKATDITDLSQAIHTSQTSTAPLSGVTPVSATQRSPVPVGKTSGIPQTTSALTGNAYIYTRKGHRHHRLVPSNSHFSDIDGTFVRCDACLCYPKIITCSSGKTSGIPQTTSALTDRSGKESTPATIDSDRSTTGAAEHPITSSVEKFSSTPKADLETDKTLPLSYTKETPISTPAKATDITDLSQGIHTSQTSSEPLSGVTPVSTSQRSSPVPVGKTSGMPETTSDHTDRSGKGSTPATIDSERSTTSAADHPLTSSVRKSSSTPKADLETDKTQPSSYTKETPISTPAKATDITDLSQAIHTSQTSTAPLSGVTPVSATQRSPVPVGKTSGIPQTTSALTGNAYIYPAKATDITDLSQAIHTSPTSTAPLSGVTPVSATQRSSPVPVGKTSGIPQTTSALTGNAYIYTRKGHRHHRFVPRNSHFPDIVGTLSGVTPVSTSQRSSPVPVGKTSGMPETTSDHTDRSGKGSTPATIDSDRSTTSAADHPLTSSVRKSSSTPKADLETDKTQPSSYTKETPISTPAKATDITDSSQAIYTSPTSTAPLSGVTPVSATQRSPVPVGKTSGIPQTTSALTGNAYIYTRKGHRHHRLVPSNSHFSDIDGTFVRSIRKESTPATIDSDRSTTGAAEHPITSSVEKFSSTPKADLETDKTLPLSYTKETPISTPAKATDITDLSQGIHTSQTSSEPLSGVTPVSTSQRSSPVPVGKTSGMPETTSDHTDRSGKESTPATIDSERSTTSAADHPLTSSVRKSSSTPKADLETDKTQPSSYTKETPISTPAKATDITDLSQAIHTSQTSTAPLSGVTPVSATQRSPVPVGKHPEYHKLLLLSLETPISTPAKATDITDLSQAIHTSPTSTAPLSGVTPVSATQRSSPVPVGKTSGIPQTTSALTDRSGKESTPATIDSDRSTTGAAEHPITSSVEKFSSTPKADLETDKTLPLSYTKETPISTPAKATDITDLSQGIHTSQTSSAPLSGVTPVSTSQRSSPVPVGKTSGMPETTSDHTDRSGKESTPATIDSDRSTTSAADHPLTSSVRKSSSTPKADLETDKTQPSSYTKETPISTPAKATDITDSSQAIYISPTSTAPLSGVTPVSATQRSPVPVGKTSEYHKLLLLSLIDQEKSRHQQQLTQIEAQQAQRNILLHPLSRKFSSTPKADLETDKTLPLSYTKETPISTPAKATDITDLSQGIHTSQTSSEPLSGVTPVSTSQRSSPVPVGKTSGMPETTSDHTDRSGKESTPATIDSERSTTSAADHPLTSSVRKSSSTPKADLETDKTQPSSYTKETPISTPAKATDITDLSQAIHTSQTSTAPLSGVTPVSATQRSSPVPVGKTSGIPQTTSALTDRSGKESTPATIDSDRSTTGAAEHPITSSVEKFSSTPKADLETDKTLPLSYTKETPISTPAKATDITDLSQGIHTSQTSSEPLSGVTPVSTSQRSSPVPVGKTSGMPETTSDHTDRSGKESTPATIDSERSTTSAADHPLTSSVRKSSSTPKADLETDKTQPSSYTKETPISTPAKATDITDLSQAIHTSQTSTAPLSGVTPVSATQRSSPVPVGKTSGIPQTTSALTDRSGKESTPATIDLDRSTTSAADHPITSSVGKSSSTPKADLETDKTQASSDTKDTPVSTPAKATDITDSSQAIHTSQTSTTSLSAEVISKQQTPSQSGTTSPGIKSTTVDDRESSTTPKQIEKTHSSDSTDGVFSFGPTGHHPSPAETTAFHTDLMFTVTARTPEHKSTSGGTERSAKTAEMPFSSDVSVSTASKRITRPVSGVKPGQGTSTESTPVSSSRQVETTKAVTITAVPVRTGHTVTESEDRTATFDGRSTDTVVFASPGKELSSPAVTEGRTIGSTVKLSPADLTTESAMVTTSASSKGQTTPEITVVTSVRDVSATTTERKTQTTTAGEESSTTTRQDQATSTTGASSTSMKSPGEESTESIGRSTRKVTPADTTTKESVTTPALPICEDPGEPRNGRRARDVELVAFENDEIEFVCDENHRLVGQRRIKCTEDGWSHPVPTCEEITCPDVRPIAYGAVRFADNTNTNIDNDDDGFPASVGETVHFECDEGYRLMGPYNITCGESGLWSDFVPSCSNDGTVDIQGQLNLTGLFGIPMQDVDYDIEEVKDNLIDLLEEMYSNDNRTKDVILDIEITDIRPKGPYLVVDFELKFNGTMPVDMVEEIITAAMENGTLGNFTVDPTYFSYAPNCPPGYCENEGECIVIYGNATNSLICRCDEGYYGKYCEEEVRTPDDPIVIPDPFDPTVEIGGGIIILALVTSCCTIMMATCMWRRRRAKRKLIIEEINEEDIYERESYSSTRDYQSDESYESDDGGDPRFTIDLMSPGSNTYPVLYGGLYNVVSPENMHSLYDNAEGAPDYPWQTGSPRDSRGSQDDSDLDSNYSLPGASSNGNSSDSD
ncbi:serine-rich adhesin for platelets-like [Ptychodera flava]|uniref:serine-rich adhesin for platelets-like n=1 Tax=Ptychodera flava TaxID=63121 RepID=UPI003969F85B